MRKSSRKKLVSVLNETPEAQLSVAELFRGRYECYVSNPDVLRSLIDHQLTEKTDLAVRAHVWNCGRCRTLYSALKAQVDGVSSGVIHSITARAPVSNPQRIDDRQLTSAEPEKKCPRCEKLLPLKEFRKCRAREDGLHLYCKRCLREKIAQSRQALREYKNQRAFHDGSVKDEEKIQSDANRLFGRRRIERMLRKNSPADRVREAIRSGFHTQNEIAQVTKLPKDEVCDALANLLLWTREIRTDVVNHSRMYFLNEVTDEMAQLPPATLRHLMPGRKSSVPVRKGNQMVKLKADCSDSKRRSGT